jgi:hypothetical protein
MSTTNKRIKFNRQVLDLIGKILDKKPELRFSQIVYQTSPYEEPWNTLKRLENIYADSEHSTQ